MKPKISTSYRPHGKWGDFLACILPLTWCINILVNSNLILRLIEWQNESSLFTIRVRSRQWYWIYKFELKNITDIISTPKNIGLNRWRFDFVGDCYEVNSYLSVIQNRSNITWVKSYWDKTILNGPKTNKSNIITPQEQIRLQLTDGNFKSDIINELYFNNLIIDNDINIDSVYTNLSTTHTDKLVMSYYSTKRYLYNFYKNIINIKLKNINNIHQNLFNLVNLDSVLKFNHDDFDELNRWYRKGFGVISPIRFMKLDFKKSRFDDLFKIRLNLKDNEYTNKVVSNNIYLTLKQKKYNRKKFINTQNINFKDLMGNITKKVKYKGRPLLGESKIIDNNINLDYTILYKLLKKNKVKNELIPITLARRLLRTKKTLVLPAHVNITIITNSYDIVHSWFIPGLGIKLDCVPGRSTHHTFFIDNVGFYYGQCAEICGRYHHHMPIRICALPFEHFLIWWSSYGLPKMLNTYKKKIYEYKYSFRKFNW